MFIRGHWIVLSNSAGEIDREFVREGDDEAAALMELLQSDWSVLQHGDTIRVIEGETEE